MSISVKILGGKPLASVKDIEELEFCFCGVDCYDSYVEKAFVGATTDENWKKDKASFLLRKIIVDDAIDFEIWKGGTKVVDIVDNTFGEYYSTFSAQPLYVGFIVDWSLVKNSFGNGLYTVRATRTILGENKPFKSRLYQVLDYSDEYADETVRIETYTNGNILSSDLNYQDLVDGGWYQSIRVGGKFGDVTEVLEQDKVLDSDRRVVSVQDSNQREYTLTTYYLPESAKKQLTNDMSLTTRTVITDYNLLNDEIIREKDVYLDSFDDVRHASRGTAYTLKYKDRFNNFLLRTF